MICPNSIPVNRICQAYFQKNRDCFFCIFLLTGRQERGMIQKVLLVWTDVFPARAQNKNTDEEAFRKCAEPHSRRSNTLRRSFRRTETKSGVVSGESQKMSAEGAMHSLLCRISQAKGQSQKKYERQVRTASIFQDHAPRTGGWFFHGKNGERLAEKET